MKPTVSQARQMIELWNIREKSRANLAAESGGSMYVLSRAKQSDLWDYNLRGRPVQRLIIYLRQPGCTFALKTAGCTMCAHSLIGTTLGDQGGFKPEYYVYQFIREYARYAAALYPVLCLYNEGNMLNPAELPRPAWRDILHLIRYEGHVERLVIESRPEYVTPANLKFTLAHLGPDIELEVGIGLESANDFVRNDIMLKAMNRRIFERAVGILKDYGARALVYVVLKPPFLSEKQAIADTIATARYAFAAGGDAVSIEPIGVQPYTITDSLYRAGLFSPPWLWSVTHVARELAGDGEVRLGGYQFAPVPETLPGNCPACDGRVIEAIAAYNRTYDPAGLAELTCNRCRPDWLAQISGDDTEIDQAEVTRWITYCHQQAAAVTGDRPTTPIATLWQERYQKMIGR